MTISWYGQSCFKIDTREATLAIDPFSKEIGLTPPRFRADIVLVTHGHSDHSNAETIPGQEEGVPPFVISGAGEYERKGIGILGIPTYHDEKQGHERGTNTAYKIEAEGVRIAHLGDFGEASLRDETVSALGDIDILFIPVGGTYTIDADTAAKVVREIEPRIVIPMHYSVPGLKVKLSPVEDFLKAIGVKNAERLDKLAIKKKDLPDGPTRTVVLNIG